MYHTIEKCAVFALSYDEDAIKDAIIESERKWGFLTTCVTLENTCKFLKNTWDSKVVD